MHLEELQEKDARFQKNETMLWKLHGEQFTQWVKEKIYSNSEEHSKKLKWLAFKPRNTVAMYKGFIINGHRFQIEELKRKTQNSGVAYDASTMYRSSTKDTKHMADIVSYYGVIQEIILLEYHMFHVPLFRRKWANKGHGLKVEYGFMLANFHLSQAAFQQDPYILHSQAKQVFYSNDDSSDWYVVMRAPPRGYHELETEEEFAAAPASIDESEDLRNESSDDDSFCCRDDCEGVLVVD